MRFLIFAVLVVIVAFLITYLVTNKDGGLSVQSFITRFENIPIVEYAGLTKKRTNKLEGIISPIIQGEEGRYGVAVKNLKTGESYYFNEHDSFDSASLYKLWVMGAVFEQIEKGQIKQSEVVSRDVSYLNNLFDISSDSAELGDGVVTSTVSNALRRMITVSDNYTALLLFERVGLSNIENFLAEHNLKETHVDKSLPDTSAYDEEQFYEQLYRGVLANKDSSGQMLELLKDQTINRKIPKYLPDELEIAHKTGELGSLSHDAGIIFSDKGDYILVVLSDSDNPKVADEKIAEISKAVYDYFNGH